MRHILPFSLRIVSLSMLLACRDTPGVVAPEILSFTATNTILQDAPTQFETIVAVTNTSANDTVVRFGCLGRELLVFNIADSLGPPIWTSRSRKFECTGSTVIVIPAASTFEDRFSASAPEVLGESEPNGIYRVEVVETIDGKEQRINAGRLNLSR